MHSRHGVSVLRTLFEAALLELQRGPIELVDQLGMPLPQPFLGQELSGQTLEPRDDPAVVGIHAATPPPAPPRRWFIRCVLLKSRVTVDGVVAVVDGAALAEGRLAADLDALTRQREADTALDHDDPIEEVFDDQIACADLVVLNKRDLLDPPGAEKAIAAIVRALPRAVKIVPVANGKVDPAALLGLGIGTEDNIANRRTRHDAELEHDHDDFESFVLPLPEISDPAHLAARIAAAAADASVLRVKGFAAVAGKPMRLLVQAVGPRVSHHYDRAWTAAEERQGQLVVIGLRGLDRDGV